MLMTEGLYLGARSVVWSVPAVYGRGLGAFPAPLAPMVALVRFIAAYTFLHVISWVQIRCRMPVKAVVVLAACVPRDRTT